MEIHLIPNVPLLSSSYSETAQALDQSESLKGISSIVHEMVIKPE
jgi:hypothetical protein